MTFDPEQEERISREDAIASGKVYYFTGEPCKYGHVERRYTKTNWCYACKRRYNKQDYYKYPSRHKEQNKREYEKHKPRHAKHSREWAIKNAEKSREIKRAWKDRNRESYNKAEAKRRKERRENDPFWRLNKNISKAVWEGLLTEKAGRTWKKFVKFTVLELKEHLETLFKEGMTWQNYGKYWEIDHIKPLSKCNTFEEAWCLTNLQPLTVVHNRSKGAKYAPQEEIRNLTESQC